MTSDADEREAASKNAGQSRPGAFVVKSARRQRVGESRE
jgi:hypothetical protein